MKKTNKTYCRLQASGAIDNPCEKQCVDCGTKQIQEQQKAITSEIDTNKVNAYTCGTCEENTVIKHRDKGVTPFMIDCFHCGNKAISHMYKVPQDLEHHLVAFKPKDKAEWKLYRQYLKTYYRNEPDVTNKVIDDMMKASKQHCDRGGVLMVTSDKIAV